jgi:acyl dehydratase
MTGPYFTDFTAGQRIEHRARKTITEAQHDLFCMLTMNHHPVHMDAEYAASALHGRILVVGTLVLALAVGLTVPEISWAAIANLGYEEVVHLAPVFVGDTLRARSTVIAARPSRSHAARGVLTVETTAATGTGDVLSFRRTLLLPVGP